MKDRRCTETSKRAVCAQQVDSVACQRWNQVGSGRLDVG